MQIGDLSFESNAERQISIAAFVNATIREEVNRALLDAGLAVPAGLLSYWTAPTPPRGWLEANGVEVDRAVYGNLFDAIGTTFGTGDGLTTFNLPDLRGVFVRGWDDERGLDIERVFGSYQEDALQEHNHNFHPQYGGNVNDDASGGVYGAIFETGSDIAKAYVGETTNARVSHETRTKNVSLLPIIKY